MTIKRELHHTGGKEEDLGKPIERINITKVIWNVLLKCLIYKLIYSDEEGVSTVPRGQFNKLQIHFLTVVHWHQENN